LSNHHLAQQLTCQTKTTSRRIDQARGDLYAIQDDLDFIKAQLRLAADAERGLAAAAKAKDRWERRGCRH
jgi:hypothetical protein